MSYLVRKINVNHWPDGENSFCNSKDELSADAITSELRTTNNALSWWLIHDESEIEKIGVSIISKLNLKQNNIKILALPYEDIADNFSLENTPENGDTAIIEMKQRHYDVCNLNYASIGNIGVMIAKATSNTIEKKVYKINVKKAISKIKELLDKGDADRELLGTYIKEELKLA